MPVRRTALVTLSALSLGVASVAVPLLASPSGAADATAGFTRLATYPVFLNLPGEDEQTVAEISAVSEDGRLVAYTDAASKRIGFLDISDPAAPEGAGMYDVGGDPTSVAIVGDHALVVVDDSDYDETGNAGQDTRGGRLDVITLAQPHTTVRSIDLGGQPDSIALSPDGHYAAIAIENQRNELLCADGATITVDPEDVEDSTCSEGDLGDLPQAPAGLVQVIDIQAAAPAAWSATPVALPEAELETAGLAAPGDAEPEYVDINEDNQLALTLQENNGIAIIDLATATVQDVFSAGNASVHGIDDDNDGIFDFTASLDAPREPDSIQWVGDGLVATANEGDWLGGTRGWTVFDATDGRVVWDAGNTFENLAVKYGLFNNDRADNKGAEPEGLAFETIGGTPYVFVGSERSNFVAVYDMTDPTRPAFRQVLPATNGPEGLLPVTNRADGRELLVISSEEDEAADLVRASVSIYEYGDEAPHFPTIESAGTPASSTTPIGWGALGALSADPSDPTRLYAASDAAFATGRIYGIDASASPAVIDSVLEVTDGDSAPEIDIEGVHARADGGFWLALEGATGPGNAVARVDASGERTETIPLPPSVSAHIKSWGLEGVTAVGRGAAEVVYVAVQRPLWVDPTLPGSQLEELEGHVARIGRYTVATGTWDWFGYPLGTTTTPGDWIGLSEITAVDHDTLAVIERDKQNGPTAALKKVYTVDIPATPGVTGDAPITSPLEKTEAHDVLPDLQAFRGWTQEKLEGLTIGGDGQVYAVTDNDGLDAATGETQLLRLGAARDVFEGELPTPSPSPSTSPTASASPTPTATPSVPDACAPAKAKVKKLKKKLRKASGATSTKLAAKLKKAKKAKKRKC